MWVPYFESKQTIEIYFRHFLVAAFRVKIVLEPEFSISLMH